METQLYACWLETYSGDLEALLHSGASGTFDMGVELGLPDFLSMDMTSLLPEFLQEAGLSPDRGMPDSLDEDGVAPTYAWKNMVTIPGMLHIVHNAETDLHAQLPDWKEYYAQLKQVLKLFHQGPQHRRFIARCVQNSR